MPQETNTAPVNYRISIEPDMVNFRFSARLELTMNAAEKTDAVQLNSIDLSITRCMRKGQEKTDNLAFQVDPGNETLSIRLPEPVTGKFTLVIDYYGEISDKMAGFYKSIYRQGEKTYVIAVTQFQESDARRAFPCIDHPRNKATFEFVIIVDPQMTAISNMPPAAETYLKSGKKQVEFQRTPMMSTYLLFFGIGNFKVVIDDLDRRVRAVILPEMEGQVRYGLAFARKSLHYCENYYDIPYPLPKIDLVAVPDFAFGAMENWGAITFRENLLLFDPDRTDAESEERICEVIAHEMAHQWFGNLVTPSDWKYLWLNESFATYFGFGVINHYHPEWGIWDNFIETQVESAMNRDALTDTSPLEIRGGDHIVINTSTAPIIYSKGASVLRQIAGFTGEEAFARGLSKYLQSHAYGCAESMDLWNALESATDKPVANIMEKWIKQAGHPIVRVKRIENKLHLSQKRFSFLPAEADSTVWPIPLVIRLWHENGRQEVLTTNFSDPQMTIDIDAGVTAYNINDSHTGFYRSHYDADSADRLLHMAEAQNLSAVDRYGLISDRFALLKADMLDIRDFIKDLGYFEDETAPLPLSMITESLFTLYLVMDGKERETIANVIRAFLEKTCHHLGYLPEKTDSHGVMRLKNKLLWCGVLLEMPEASRIAQEQFERLTGGQGVNSNITRAVLQAGAFMDGDKAFDWFVYRLETAADEHERQNIQRALGCFSQPELIKRARNLILTNVPQRNMHLPVAWAAMNPHAKDSLWDWFTENLESLEKIHPIIFERILSAITPVCSLDRHEEIFAFLEAYLSEKPYLGPSIRMSMEKRSVYHCMRDKKPLVI